MKKTAQRPADGNLCGRPAAPSILKPAIRSQVSCQGHLLTVAGRAYDLNNFRRVILIGAGKATALMAKALEELLADRLSEGLILVKHGYATPLGKHPGH